MAGRRFISGPACLVAALAMTACTSRDDKAAAAAAIAADALQQGQLPLARFQINKALAVRDDIGDYWMLSAHIALAQQDYGTAFNAYESVVMFDRSNAEALTRLCQIALSADQPQRAERYAATLASLHPGDPSAVTVQAALALKNGDKQTAKRLLDQVLAADPVNPLTLIVKSRLLLADEDYAGAAQIAERSLTAPGDPGGRLSVLKDIYRKSKDVEGYRRTIARFARAYPQSAAAQMDYASSLYDAGEAESGLAVARQVLTLRPDDVGAANGVLNLWIAHGGAAMPLDAIVAYAANGSPETKAAYAQYANAIGRADLALTIAGDEAAGVAATAANADIKAARAYAQVLRGDTGPAAAEIAAILSVDADHPRALVARAALRAGAGDRRGAIEDLRHALAGDADNASARLALADLQLADGSGILATATLQEGLNDPGADPRIATRLATMLRAQDRSAEAAAVIENYTRNNPFAPPLPNRKSHG